MRIDFSGVAPAAVALALRKLSHLRPPPTQTITEWACENRVLSRRDGARPGPFRPEPHQPAIMDAFNDPDVARVVVMACSQFAGKSVMMGNVVGYYADLDPSNMMILHPTLGAAEKWAKGRLDPMIEESPRLREVFPPRRSRSGDQTILHRLFRGGQAFIVGANAPTDLAAQTVRVLMADEVDRYEKSSGAGDRDEGDPLELAEQRTVDYGEFARIGHFSTPLVEGASRIEASYEESDKQVWELRCPHCRDATDPESGYFRVMWEHVRFTDPETGEKRPELAHVRCPLCEAAWSEGDRLQAIDDGRWRATAPFAGIRGFHINAFGCKRANLEKLVRRFLRALGNPKREQTFANLVEARTWRPRAEAPPWERLFERRETWPTGILPEGALALTAGADVQKDRIEVRVWGWAKGGECWHIERRILLGETNREPVWDDLSKLLEERWQAASGVELTLERLAVDSGAYTEEVYRWARPFRADRRVMLIKGAHGQAVVLGLPAKQEITTRGKRAKWGVRVWPVGGAKAKEWLYTKLGLSAPMPGEPAPAGYVHLSTRADDQEIKQLTAEEMRTGKDKFGRSRVEWHVKPGHRNEALDCWVYAYAAAIEWGLWRKSEADWTRLAGEVGAPPPALEELETIPAPPVAPPQAAPRPEPRPSAASRNWLGNTKRWL